MSNASDFVIENGMLTEYTGSGGKIVIPDEVIGIGGYPPPFLGISEPFELTLSPNMKCDGGELLSETITVLNIPAGTDIKCTSFGPNYSQFYKLLREINVDPANRHCASESGILFSKDMSTLCSCPAAHEGNVVIPSSVKQIGPHAFDGCNNLTEIVIPDTVEVIGERAFMDCKSLKRIVIQGEKTVIGKDAFLRCTKITTAGLNGSMTGKKGNTFEFPWAEEIPENAFSGLTKLKTAVLPETVKSIGKNAFSGCKGMEEISMPVGVKYDKKLFKDCKKLSITESKEGAKTPDTPKGLVIQNNTLVSYKGKERDLHIPDGVTVIGRRAFYGNRTLVSVTLPASVEAVEQEAFDDCLALQSINIQGVIKQAGARAFGFFLEKDALELSVYSVTPISAFTKAAQDTVLRVFSRRFAEFDQSSDTYRDNLAFIGSHLKQPQEYGGKLFYHYLSDNEALRHAVLDARAIPAKDVDWLVSALQAEGNTAFVAELLEYKDRLLADKKVKKALEKAEARAEEKALSAEMSVADWRKKLKFSYEDGYIVIKEVKIKEPIIELPDHIGEKRVRVIGYQAFSFFLKAGETDRWCPEKIVLPEGVEEIRSGAFFCAENTEIYFPSTVKSLPKGCFYAVENLTLHIPASVTEIADELEFDSGEHAFKAIHAPAGSCAEQYAKEHGIPFVVE